MDFNMLKIDYYNLFTFMWLVLKPEANGSLSYLLNPVITLLDLKRIIFFTLLQKPTRQNSHINDNKCTYESDIIRKISVKIRLSSILKD